MCGICGAVAASHISKHEQDNIKKLLFLNTFRGRDSTGMFDFVIVKERPKFQKKKNFKPVPPSMYWKEVLPAYEFAELVVPDVQENRWVDHTPKAIVCHARSATVGKVSKENAHPHISDNIIGVHNGTISGDFEGKKEHEVDSAALFMNIQKYGPKKAIEKAYEKASQVAYALVWMDTNTNIVYFLRNLMRPLAYFTRSGTVYFSSDKKDLMYTFDVLPSSPELKEFKPNVLYSLDLNKTGYAFIEEDLDIRRPVYSPPVYEYSSYGNSSIHNQQSTDARRRGFNDTPFDEKNQPKVPPFRQTGNRTLPSLTGMKSYPQAYQSYWKDKTWQQFTDQGYISKDKEHPHYEIAQGRWYTDFVFSMFQAWQSDHNIEYSHRLKVMWDSLSPHVKSSEMAKCTFPPIDFLPDDYKVDTPPFSRDNVIDLQAAKEDLKFPFGTAGLKCSEDMYKRRVKCGCSLCGQSVEPAEADETYWMNGTDYLCNSCAWDVAYSDDAVKKCITDQDLVVAFLDKIHREQKLKENTVINTLTSVVTNILH